MAHRKKIAGRWRRRFLSALARTANVGLAAEMAAVDRTTAYLLRQRDPGFAAAWRRALAWGRARVKAEGRPVHPGGRPRQARAGEAPPDPRGLIVRHSKHGKTQIVRAGEGRWTPEAEDSFIVHVVVGYGVRHSAKAAGFSTTAVYNRRLNDARFRARWDLAVEEGMARNDGLLIDSVPRALDPEIIEAAEGVKGPTIAEAIQIVRLYRCRGGSGGGLRHGPPEPSIEAVRDDVLSRLDSIRRHRADRGEGDGGPGKPGGNDD